MTTSRDSEFDRTTRMPAEWEPHRATWMAWPHDVELWGETHTRVIDEFVALCRLIGRGERIELLVHESIPISFVAECLGVVDVGFHPAVYGDIWLRDTAPLFVRSGVALEAVSMVFNGWGEKYRLEGDTEPRRRMVRGP